MLGRSGSFRLAGTSECTIALKSPSPTQDDKPSNRHRKRDVSGMIERGAEAMRLKRRELINQPLDRIWPDLMQVALEAVREPLAEIADRHSYDAAQAIRRAARPQ